MNAAQQQTEPMALLEELEERTLMSGDVMAGAFVAESLIPGSNLNNVAITAQPSADNALMGGDVKGALAAAATVSMLTETHPAPTQTVGQSEQGLLGNGDQTSTLFDEDAGGDWNTSDLAGQNILADVSALKFNTIDQEF